jgi:hypothetical protein
MLILLYINDIKVPKQIIRDRIYMNKIINFKETFKECRMQAEDVFKNGKPKNWIAGSIIILIWLLIAVWITISICF